MRIALIGYGKMGKAIEQTARKRGHETVLIIHSSNSADLTTQNLRSADVAIEISTPQTAASNILKCFDAAIPVVCGTTGWLDRLEEITAQCLSRNQAFLYASNFSIGVNIFFEINQRLAELMDGQPQYKVRMEEIHHSEKKDSPSGTAITLASQILSRVSRLARWVNQDSIVFSELPIISKRIDQVPGTHRVVWQSDRDELEIIHTAHSREGFAAGAVAAAEWIREKKGVFEMRDVLGL